jgi:anti-sigma B factor antagonist
MSDEKSLSIDIEPYDGGVVLRPHGNVDLASSPDLRTALREAIDRKPDKTIIELSGVAYMDSSGVATLVEALQLARRGGGQLVLCSLSERVHSIFQIARLDSIFTIVADLDAALKA